MTMRPRGTNADEWRLFLSGYLDSRATSADGLSFVAVQIAEAIEMEREQCAKIADLEAAGLRNGGAINAARSIAADIRARD